VTTDRDKESTVWKIHGERLIEDTRRLQLSIASVELPDGVQFEQYVLRMPKAAMMVVLDDAQENILMMWRHRFIIDRWAGNSPADTSTPTKTQPSPQLGKSRRRPAGDPAARNPWSHSNLQ
jgi:hypothetical protein